jgi:rod shape-determining protein MreC
VSLAAPHSHSSAWRSGSEFDPHFFARNDWPALRLLQYVFRPIRPSLNPDHMFTLQRWWERHGRATLGFCVAMAVVLTIRQTQGAFLLELYQSFTRSFQGEPKAPQVASDQLKELQGRLTELQTENQRLSELMGFAKAASVKGLPAPVIGRSADHWWEQITLGRGSSDGVELDQIVMSPTGLTGKTEIKGVLIGQIKSITPHTSRVLLLSDPTNKVGVVVSRSRATGSMWGQKDTKATIEFYSKTPDVRKGDPVAISALSSKFPKGLPIGYIESVDLAASPAPKAVVDLTARLASLEWVMIYPSAPVVDESAQTAPGQAAQTPPKSSPNSPESPDASSSGSGSSEAAETPAPKPSVQP